MYHFNYFASSKTDVEPLLLKLMCRLHFAKSLKHDNQKIPEISIINSENYSVPSYAFYEINVLQYLQIVFICVSDEF